MEGLRQAGCIHDTERCIGRAGRYHCWLRCGDASGCVLPVSYTHLGALAATAQEKYQKAFRPLPEGFSAVELGDLEALEQAIRPETCAVMLEPIQGESGIHVPTQEYMQGVQALCRKHGILLILDEVQTGIGRTGKAFRCV